MFAEEVGDGGDAGASVLAGEGGAEDVLALGGGLNNGVPDHWIPCSEKGLGDKIQEQAHSRLQQSGWDPNHFL